MFACKFASTTLIWASEDTETNSKNVMTEKEARPYNQNNAEEMT
jgi:hypothetical protein